VAVAAPAYETYVHALPANTATVVSDPTATATVVTPEEKPAGASDLGLLLREVPGAVVTRYGGLGAFTAVSLRGSNPDEVRVYLDGVPLNEAVGGAVDLSKIPLGDVERVEVFRGTTPLLFGESAMGGIVAISSRTPGAPLLKAQASLGSFGTWGADLGGAQSLGRLHVYAGVHALASSGDYPWHNPSDVVAGYDPGTRQNNDFVQGSAVLRAVVDLPGRRSLRASLLGFGQGQGVAGSTLNRVVGARDAVARGVGSLSYESREELGASSRLALVGYAGLTRDHFQDVLATVVGIPTDVRDTTLSLGARSEAEKAVTSWARVLMLIEARRETWSPTNLLAPSDEEIPALRSLGTLGAETRLMLGPTGVLVVPSFRLEAARDRVTGRQDITANSLVRPTVSHLSPVWHLGASRSLGAVFELKANTGHYVRLPSFLELYGYDGRVIGNSTLAPEKGLNADLGLSARAGTEARRFEGSLTGFATRATDLVDWVSNANGQIRPRNLSSARIFGGEVEGRVVVGAFRVAGQGTFLDARDEGPIAASHGRLLPRRPRERLNVRAAWRPAWLPGVNDAVLLELSADVDVTAGAFASPSNDVAMPSRALLGAGLRAVHPRSGLRLLATAANLGDWRGADFPGFPLPGRSFFLALGWSSAKGLD
jgi:iron complex outermembrane receptor protein